MKKTLLIGLGAQKAGTTWLHHCLIQSPKYDYWFSKEWRILEAYRNPDKRALLISRMKNQIKSRRVKKGVLDFFRGANKRDSIAEWETRLKLLKDVDEVIPVRFAEFAKDSSSQVLGDLSPANGQLGREHLNRLVELARQNDMDTRFVLRMRDPLSRVKSGVLHRLKRDAQLEGVGLEDYLSRFNINQVVRDREGLLDRTDYRKIIENVEHVAGPSKLLTCFFEEGFSQGCVNACCDFLGIESVPALAKTKNASRLRIDLNVETEKWVVDQLRPIYEFVFSRFGSRVERLWASSQYLK